MPTQLGLILLSLSLSLFAPVCWASTEAWDLDPDTENLVAEYAGLQELENYREDGLNLKNLSFSYLKLLLKKEHSTLWQARAEGEMKRISQLALREARQNWDIAPRIKGIYCEGTTYYRTYSVFDRAGKITKNSLTALSYFDFDQLALLLRTYSLAHFYNPTKATEYPETNDEFKLYRRLEKRHMEDERILLAVEDAWFSDYRAQDSREAVGFWVKMIKSGFVGKDLTACPCCEGKRPSSPILRVFQTAIGFIGIFPSLTRHEITAVGRAVGTLARNFKTPQPEIVAKKRREVVARLLEQDSLLALALDPRLAKEGPPAESFEEKQARIRSDLQLLASSSQLMTQMIQYFDLNYATDIQLQKEQNKQILQGKYCKFNISLLSLEAWALEN